MLAEGMESARRMTERKRRAVFLYLSGAEVHRAEPGKPLLEEETGQPLSRLVSPGECREEAKRLAETFFFAHYRSKRWGWRGSDRPLV